MKSKVAWKAAIARMRAGIETNADIARDLGVSRERVRQVRAKLGIAPVLRPVAFEIALQAAGRLGAEPDVTLAAELGVRTDAIRAAREHLGIEVHHPQAAHGTRNRYVNGCRCAACAEAARVYSRDVSRRNRRAAGATLVIRRCTACHQVGHNRSTCPGVL